MWDNRNIIAFSTLLVFVLIGLSAGCRGTPISDQVIAATTMEATKTATSVGTSLPSTPTIALSTNPSLTKPPVAVSVTPVTPALSITPDSSPTSLFPTVAPLTEWLVYQNDFYGYEFSYPPTANISVTGVDNYPSDEKPEDLSYDEFLNQLRETYPDDICVTIRYMYGFITIRAPQDNGGRYTICGRSGVGDYNVVEKTEVVTVNGESITSQGMALYTPEDNIKPVRELFQLYLPDGTEINYEYAVGVSDTGNVKDVLIQIISTFHYED